MSVRSKRRETEVFSLAFLDCICCGFGAVLLVFILSLTQKKIIDQESVDDVKSRSHRLEAQLVASQTDLDRLKKVLAAAQLELEDINAKNNQDELKLSDRHKELLLMLAQTGSLKDALATLLGEKKLLPTEEKAPVPIPNIDRRQYLTGIKTQGAYVVFLVRCSGSMLDDTIENATARLPDTDIKKREAPKWVRTIHALEWMLANLDPETHFQVLFFNEETFPLLADRPDEWFKTSDRVVMGEVIGKLNSVVPQGAANLERAFTTVRYLQHLPDDIVLFTDGLPTKSDSIIAEGEVREEERLRFFNVAIKQLPPRIPVSTILFPMSGDPASTAKYWELANFTRGALVSPAKSWPDT